jgi:hypothetical protein
MGDAVGGSWRRVLITAGVAVLLFGAVVGLAASGRLGDFRYMNLPGHPYPPSGYVVNPFGNDRGDLVRAADATKVKADFLADGRVELQAVLTGDPSVLSQSTTGNALTALGQVIATNKQAGIVEREDIHITSITVGRLVDPNRIEVSWCVEETGTGTIARISQASGATIGTQTVHFRNRFWLVQVGDRYLITDVLINSGSGSS